MLKQHFSCRFPRVRPLLFGSWLVVFVCLGGQAGAVPHPWGIGHRGGNYQRPENTLPAFQFSLDGGGDGVEVDVWLSSDGIAVCHHDELLDRTTDGTGSITLKTLAELKTLDAGSWFAPEYAGLQIPSFQEALAVIEGHKLFLDIKATSYVSAIVQELEDYGFPADDVWVWNRLGTGAPFLAAMPEAHGVGALSPEVDPEALLPVLLAGGYDALDVNFRLADQELIDLVHSYGLAIMTHTVTSPNFQHQINMDVDIIVATAPTILATLLPGPTPECSDGVDNDGDGDTDTDDESCFGSEDPTEDDECSDGIDNDGDGDTDHLADEGCFGPYSSTESPACSDGIDNNEDGDIDYPADAGCLGLYDQHEQASCADGLDNDEDGRVDYPDDIDCPSIWSNDEAVRLKFESPFPLPALSTLGGMLAASALILTVFWVQRAGHLGVTRAGGPRVSRGCEATSLRGAERWYSALPFPSRRMSAIMRSYRAGGPPISRRRRTRRPPPGSAP